MVWSGYFDSGLFSGILQRQSPDKGGQGFMDSGTNNCQIVLANYQDTRERLLLCIYFSEAITVVKCKKRLRRGVLSSGFLNLSAHHNLFREPCF